MRAHQLKRLGFHTGSPFADRTSSASSSYSPSIPRSASSSSSPSVSRVASSERRAGTTTTAGSASPSSSSSSPARQRRGDSNSNSNQGGIAARVGRSGQLDPGRLAAARSHYEQQRSQNNSQQIGSRANSTSDSNLTALPLAASSSSSSSASIRRRASHEKRLREDDDNEERKDASEDAMTQEPEEYDDKDSSIPDRKRQKRAGSNGDSVSTTTTGIAKLERSMSEDMPPLEGSSSFVPMNPFLPPIPPAVSSRGSLSHVESLTIPLSTLQQQQAASAAAAAASSSSSNPSTPSASAPGTPIDFRAKTQSLIEQSLQAAETKSDSSSLSSQPVTVKNEVPLSSSTLSASIEQALFQSCSQSSGTAYRKRARSLIFNLKQNLTLAHRLLRGIVTPQKLCTMSEDELASAETRQERESLRAMDLSAHVAKLSARMPSHEYRCHQCGSDECSTRVLREERDISKADTWGSKQGAGSVIDIMCEKCKHSWTKEE